MPRIHFSTEIPSFSELRQIRVNWTWQELLWGKCNGLLQAEDAVAYALELLDEDRENFAELLGLATEDPKSWEIDKQISALCGLEAAESDEEMLLAWRKTILKWCYDHIEDEKQIREKVNCLYDDFERPEDMACMIPYMPASIDRLGREWNVRTLLREWLECHSDA